jgi:hypothetical protein
MKVAVPRSFLSLLLVSAGLAAGAALANAPGRVSLGIFDAWGAFRDAPAATGTRCYAIAASDATVGTPRWKSYASVGFWPKRGVRGQFFVRLSRDKAAGAAIRLSIAGRRFILVGNGSSAWAGDKRMDAAIIAAMRSAEAMSIETTAANGGAIADAYRLRGAATAIDAAALGCAGQR